MWVLVAVAPADPLPVVAIQPLGPLFSARLIKVVNHEFGHTLGLDHCPVAGCLMQDAKGKIATMDGESGRPCAGCSAKLPLKE